MQQRFQRLGTPLVGLELGVAVGMSVGPIVGENVGGRVPKNYKKRVLCFIVRD